MHPPGRCYWEQGPSWKKKWKRLHVVFNFLFQNTSYLLHSCIFLNSNTCRDSNSDTKLLCHFQGARHLVLLVNVCVPICPSINHKELLKCVKLWSKLLTDQSKTELTWLYHLTVHCYSSMIPVFLRCHLNLYVCLKLFHSDICSIHIIAWFSQQQKLSKYFFLFT